jgi:hypothetical protein
MAPAPWALAELASATFGDRRLTRRAADLLTVLVDHPEASVPAACGSWAATKAAYRFWDNADATPAVLLTAHADATRARCAAHALVLAVQDTTALDLTGHPTTTGTGPLGRGRHTGLHVHTVLAVTPDGEPVGLLDQHVWARDPAAVGSRHRRRERPTAEKESQRWLDALAATHAALPEARVVTIGDREADIFDLFAAPRPASSDLLIRAAHNRCVGRDPDAYLWDVARAADVLGATALTVPRQANRPERQATLAVRAAPVHLQPPHGDRSRDPIAVTAVLAEEPDPPPDQRALCWLLLTTVPVPDLAAATRCLAWYRRRWVIERFHFVLKSGCGIERVQLETAERMERALATLSIVAWRVAWLAEQARQTPEAPCTTLLTAAQWAALHAAVTKRPDPAPPPVSLAQATRWIAHLGGFLGRKGDGDPGVKTVWRGWRRLEDLTAIWVLLHPNPSMQTYG